MRISIIIASYLSPYVNCASDQQSKFMRAVESCLKQSHEDTEIVIVSDGCDITDRLINSHFAGRVTHKRVDKQPIWSGVPRQRGIEAATGEVVCYCDTDDYLGVDHCRFIADNFGQNDWVYFDDLMYLPELKNFLLRKCLIYKKYFHGTSNIAHRRNIGTWLNSKDYLHDHVFIKSLLKQGLKCEHIGAGQYYVCHIPKIYDI